MNKMRLLFISLIVVIILSATLWFVLNLDTEKSENGLTVSSVMSSESSGFKKADTIINFEFPKDHFAHYDYKTEWWYFTGNLTTKEGKRFGYQFTIFRNGIIPGKGDTTSGFETGSVYSAHLGISDISNGKFYSTERFARGIQGLAGSNPKIGKIEIEGIELVFDAKGNSDKPGMRISASAKDFSFTFKLEPEKKMVLQGEKGLSRKSNQGGNASYYYSFTRIKTDGKLTVSGQDFEIAGWSWMDREWSTSALETDQKGWDWFALQLDDYSELMYFRLRDKDGNTNFQKGSLIFSDGSYKTLKSNELKISVLNSATIGKTTYPSEWRIDIQPENLTFNITTAMKNQVHNFRISYYEGAVNVEKFDKGKPTSGKGYVELTGYAD